MVQGTYKDQAMLVDFHSHILPSMDDGSKDAEQSIAMLAEAARQGTSVMVATPHFYPENEDPSSFLRRRAASIAQLLDGGYDPEVYPRVCVGAEVAYFRGIGRCDDLKKLCIVGTSVILIEMPFCRWTDTILEDVSLIRTWLGLTPILAHIERYPDMNKAAMRHEMLCRGFVLQINASMMDGLLTRRHAMHMLQRGEVQLLGSDCHNMTTRSPGMQNMLQYMMNHTGQDILPQMVRLNRHLLRGAIPLENISSDS